MTVWLVGVYDCDGCGKICVCSTKEIAERELFKKRDALVEEWKRLDQDVNKEIEGFCKKTGDPVWVENMYKKMIENLSGDNYKEWDNYPHEVIYIEEIQVIEK